ncbi:MAG: four helix bundle protein [Armatimonadota bacterium]|nr:four helix bundle protein [Armatimonadota bacterium]
MADERFGFERLEVWQRAVRFASLVYEMTKVFPRDELFGLTTQLRRASVSVAANIAEGASRTSRKDQARFFEIAYGSLNEMATMFHIASLQALITEDMLTRARNDILKMCMMLSGLKRAALGGERNDST